MPVKKPFTHEQQQEIGQRYQAGESMATIALAMGINSGSITRVLRRLGIKSRPSSLPKPSLVPVNERNVKFNYYQRYFRYEANYCYRRWWRFHLPFEAFEQVAYIAGLRAIELWEGKGNFEAYAMTTIRWYTWKMLQKESWVNFPYTIVDLDECDL